MQKPQPLNLAEAEAVVTKYVREACNHYLGKPIDHKAIKESLMNALSGVDWSSCFVGNEEREALAEILVCDWTDSLSRQADPDAFIKALLTKISDRTLAEIVEVAAQSFAGSIMFLELNRREGHVQSWKIDSVDNNTVNYSFKPNQPLQRLVFNVQTTSTNKEAQDNENLG
jgi:hypothetical protein